jgi:hypothetical protein
LGPTRGAARAADGVVPQHLELGARRRASDLEAQPDGSMRARTTRGSASCVLTSSEGPGGAPTVLVCDNETNTQRRYGALDGPKYPEGRDQRPRRARRRDGESRTASGPRRALARGHPRSSAGDHDTRLLSRARTARRSGESRETSGSATTSTRSWARRAEADEFYAELTPATASDDEALVLRQAFAGLLWGKQLYYYDVAALAGRRPDPATSAAVARRRPQRAVAQLRRLRHHVDARQVGVPVVRRVGPRVPLRGARADRPGLREVPAHPPVPRVVPASKRRAAGLRVGLR